MVSNIPVPLLTKALEEALRGGEDTWKESTLHVSDLSVGLPLNDGGMCPRQLWLRLNGYKKREPSIGQMLMWDHGNRIEFRVNDLAIDGLIEQGWELLYSHNKKVELPGGVIGEYDALLANQESGIVLVLDNKTARGRAFNFLNEARSSHIIQVQGYIKAFDAHGGMIWYIDREGQNSPLEFFVPRDDYAVELCLKYATAIYELDEPPPIIYPVLSIKENKQSTSILAKQRWQCDYCDYQDLSCDGPLPYDLRSSGGKVIGHIKDGEAVIKDEYKNNEVLARAVDESGVEVAIPF